MKQFDKTSLLQALKSAKEAGERISLCVMREGEDQQERVAHEKRVTALRTVMDAEVRERQAAETPTTKRKHREKGR